MTTIPGRRDLSQFRAPGCERGGRVFPKESQRQAALEAAGRPAIVCRQSFSRSASCVLGSPGASGCLSPAARVDRATVAWPQLFRALRRSSPYPRDCAGESPAEAMGTSAGRPRKMLKPAVHGRGEQGALYGGAASAAQLGPSHAVRKTQLDTLGSRKLPAILCITSTPLADRGSAPERYRAERLLFSRGVGLVQPRQWPAWRPTQRARVQTSSPQTTATRWALLHPCKSLVDQAPFWHTPYGTDHHPMTEACAKLSPPGLPALPTKAPSRAIAVAAPGLSLR